jgi:hypothetical protein
VLHVSQMDPQMFGNDRRRGLVGVDTDMATAHGHVKNDVMRKKESQIRDSRLKLVGRNDANTTSMEIMIDNSVVHARMLLRHGSSFCAAF